MRTVIISAGIVVLGGLSLSGCAGTLPREAAVPAGPPPNVAFYDVAPPGALPLGPIKVTVCDGTRPVVTRRILEAAAVKGGNGVTQLTCHNEGMSMACFSRWTCEGQAVNVLPPPPPPPPPVRKRRSKRR